MGIVLKTVAVRKKQNKTVNVKEVIEIECPGLDDSLAIGGKK